MTDRSNRSATRRPSAPARRAGPGPARTAGSQRISPGVVFLVLAIVGSIAYMAYTVTVRDTSQIPLLASGAVVLAVVFAALAAYCLRSIWRAGREGGGGGRVLLVALVGGGAAMAAAGFAAGAIILFQVASG